MEVYKVEVDDNGSKFWCQNKLHRLDGAAVENINGADEYWVDGKKVEAGEDYRKAVVIYLALNTPEGQIALKKALPEAF